MIDTAKTFTDNVDSNAFKTTEKLFKVIFCYN